MCYTDTGSLKGNYLQDNLSLGIQCNVSIFQFVFKESGGGVYKNIQFCVI